MQYTAVLASTFHHFAHERSPRMKLEGQGHNLGNSRLCKRNRLNSHKDALVELLTSNHSFCDKSSSKIAK